MYFVCAQIVQKAVYSSMHGNLQRRHTMQRLHIFPDEDVPKSMLQNVCNEIRQERPVPIKLDEIPLVEQENFPRLIQYPINYEYK